MTGGLAKAAFLLTLPCQAIADPVPFVAAALDRFQTACAAALADPDAYAAALILPGPAGEPGRYESPDGRLLLIHTAQSEGVTDIVEVARFEGAETRRCAITAVLPGFPEASDVAAALEPMLSDRASEIVGGRIDPVTPIWEPGEAAVAYEGDPVFAYRATGMFDFGAVAAATARLGSVEFSVARLLADPEASR